jgi:hypothetical protein
VVFRNGGKVEAKEDEAYKVMGQGIWSFSPIDQLHAILMPQRSPSWKLSDSSEAQPFGE